MLILGLLFGSQHNASELTFTYSLLWLSIIVGIGALGAAPGAFFVLGYAIGDFFLLTRGDLGLGRLGLLVSYLVLALLVVVVPRAVTALRRRTMGTHPGSGLRAVIEIAVGAICMGALVVAWSLAAAGEVRPAFTWRPAGIPDLSAISPLQQGAPFLAVVGLIAGAVRVILEKQSVNEAEVRAYRESLDATLQRIRPRPPMGPVVAVPVQAAFFTVVLAGYVTDWLEVPPLFLGLCASLLVRRLSGHVFPAWSRAIDRVPVLIRMAVGTAVAIVLARAIIAPAFGSTESFRPVIDAIIVSALVFALLLPQERVPAPGQARV
jgi:hypothetical protein